MGKAMFTRDAVPEPNQASASQPSEKTPLD
jgi:hypothetical protein